VGGGQLVERAAGSAAGTAEQGQQGQQGQQHRAGRNNGGRRRRSATSYRLPATSVQLGRGQAATTRVDASGREWTRVEAGGGGGEWEWQWEWGRGTADSRPIRGMGGGGRKSLGSVAGRWVAARGGRRWENAALRFELLTMEPEKAIRSGQRALGGESRRVYA
jgi:hypothetical protein